MHLFLENQQIIIVEIRRMDLDRNAGKSEIYRWLLLDKNTLCITPLTFISMDSSGLSQERFFKEGYLSFDSQKAFFILESSSVQHIFDINMPGDFPDSLYKLVKSVFSKQ